MHVSLIAAALLGIAVGAHAALPVDEVSTTPVVPAVKNRLYVGDFSINHILDGRLSLYDADTGRFQGVIGTGLRRPVQRIARSTRVLCRHHLPVARAARRPHHRRARGLRRRHAGVPP
jgi:methylamine dehydrogenase heavy chain